MERAEAPGHVTAGAAAGKCVRESAAGARDGGAAAAVVTEQQLGRGRRCCSGRYIRLYSISRVFCSVYLGASLAVCNVSWPQDAHGDTERLCHITGHKKKNLRFICVRPLGTTLFWT